MTQPDYERIRVYLQGQAAQRTTDELCQRVQEAVDELAAAARGVPASMLHVIPDGDEWTPMACLKHSAAS
ncbi:MAG: hypothetical protein ABIP13_09965, partial [Tepidiformaceae bacterium]